MAGRPCPRTDDIGKVPRSTPHLVELVLSLLAQGVSKDEIRKDYPALCAEDVQACLAYAHAVIARNSLDDIKVG